MRMNDSARHYVRGQSREVWLLTSELEGERASSHRQFRWCRFLIDSGLSIDFIKRMLLAQNPKSFSVVSLLYKSKAVKIDFPIEYIGFKIPNDFVVGYGLDYAQKGRNIPAVYKIVEKKK